MREPRAAAQAAVGSGPRIEYRPAAETASLGARALLIVAFGGTAPSPDPTDAPTPSRPAAAPLSSAALCVRVGLNALGPAAQVEVWWAAGPIARGCERGVRYASDDEHLAGVIELDEREHGGIANAARHAYAELSAFCAGSDYPHPLRLWNYFDAINEGADDAERYKQFCVGRAAGLRLPAGTGHPAATAIGRRDGDPRLLVYFLAARRPGTALENPRQLAAYRYPRQYGPAAPRFSRAVLTSGPTLFISGTSSIVGHASQHGGNLLAQVRETLLNIQSLERRAAALAPGLSVQRGAGTLLKVYLREPAQLPALESLLAETAPGARCLVLEADICRRELLVEIDCVHTG